MGVIGHFELPVVDASSFQFEDAVKANTFAAELLDALTRHGFVKVVNHGISDGEIERMFDWARTFFRLPIDVKRKMEYQPGPHPQRGWSCIGAENTAKLFGALTGQDRTIKHTDMKENLDIGSVTDTLYPNKWLDHPDISGFRNFFERFYEQCESISVKLLMALENSLGLPPGTFTHKCRQHAHELRLNRYPSVTCPRGSPTLNVQRAWPHTDLGVITCLFQDAVGGLEIEDRSRPGTFHPVHPGQQGELIVNISETMQRWTNGTIPATIHHVTLPPGVDAAVAAGQEVTLPERYSIPFFVKADRDTSVGTLPQFLDGTTSEGYPEMTALEFHVKRIAKAY